MAERTSTGERATTSEEPGRGLSASELDSGDQQRDIRPVELSKPACSIAAAQADASNTQDRLLLGGSRRQNFGPLNAGSTLCGLAWLRVKPFTETSVPLRDNVPPYKAFAVRLANR